MKHSRKTHNSSHHSPVHVKLDYPEAVEYKKEVLMIQMHLLHALSHLKKYNELRSNELKTKLLLNKTLSETNLRISTVKRLFPSIETTEKNRPSAHKDSLRDEFLELEEKISGGEETKKTGNDTLNLQLLEIQRKLRDLQ